MYVILKSCYLFISTYKIVIVTADEYYILINIVVSFFLTEHNNLPLYIICVNKIDNK